MRCPAAAFALSCAILSPSVRVLQAQTSGPITTAEIDGHLRFLASDLLEGRAPATRGGRLAAEYIAAELRSSGIQPGVNGSYFQPVPIDIVTTDQSSIHANASGKATATFNHPNDVVLWAGSAEEKSRASGELVFIGYGAAAPEYKWDDFKGEDLKGKVLLVLVNDPPATPAEPNLFGGRAMTYYGRWTYKYEEAERRGASGMLIIHTTEKAAYPWQVVVGSNSTEHRLLPRPSTAPAPIGIRGWIKDTVAAKLLAQAGLNLDQLTKSAESRDFRPVHTGITMDMSLASRVSHLQSENVVGVIPGKDPKLKDEYVSYSAHWDHLGIGRPVNGDSIYNGAYDNASGVSVLLAAARAIAADPKTKRSNLFVFVTAEESGLLGSQYFGEHPTVPATSIIANLNVDEASVAGRTRDLEVLGKSKSSLGSQLQAFLGSSVKVVPEDKPEYGSFYRSDHFSFAKVGIPAVSIQQGVDYIGKPKDFGVNWNAEFNAKRYHQPSDEYSPNFDLSGAVQIADVIHRFGEHLANSASVPTWAPDAEFRSARKVVQ